MARQILVMLEQRCGICGLRLDRDRPVWHVVDGEASRTIMTRLAAGEDTGGVVCTTYEVPGHRNCILFAATACPYLSQPTGRRSTTTRGPAPVIEAGTARGEQSAVVAFDWAHLEVRSDSFQVNLGHPRRGHPYRVGTDLLPLLSAAIAGETGLRVDNTPSYLGVADGAVLARLAYHGLAVSVPSNS